MSKDGKEVSVDTTVPPSEHNSKIRDNSATNPASYDPDLRFEEISVDTQVPSQMINDSEIRDNSATNPASDDSKSEKLKIYNTRMSESFNLLTTSLKALARQQFSQNDQYAFWNGTGSKEVALKAPGLALESSHIGKLFDDLGSYLNGTIGDTDAWDPHLWTELSRAYALW